MKVTFPWKRADSGMIFAGIAARYLRISIGEILGTAKVRLFPPCKIQNFFLTMFR